MHIEYIIRCVFHNKRLQKKICYYKAVTNPHSLIVIIFPPKIKTNSYKTYSIKRLWADNFPSL